MHFSRGVTLPILMLFTFEFKSAELYQLNRRLFTQNRRLWHLRNYSCPVPATDCDCQHNNNGTSLAITCLRAASNSSVLLPAMNELLSSLASNSWLTDLSITHTPLTQVPMALCNVTSLVTLSLAQNQLLSLPNNCFSRLKQLRMFSALGNNITHLQDGLLHGLAYLQQLQLRNNDIQFVGSRLFSNLSELPSLNVINLSSNKLTSLDPWPIFRAQAFPAAVVTVDVCDNSIRTPANWTYDKCGGEELNYKLKLCADNASSYADDFMDGYFTGSGYIPCHIRKFRGHVGRRSIIRGGKIIIQAGNVTLNGGIIHGDEVIIRANNIDKNGGIITTVRDPGTCVCLDFSIYGSLSAYKDSSSYNAIYTYCGMKRELIFTQPTDWLENFVCNVKFQSPVSCSCYSQPSNATFHVICSGLGLNELPFHLPSPNIPYITFMRKPLERGVDELITKYKVDVSCNKLHNLEARPYFDNTAVLDVSHSQIENITDEALEALKTVDKIYLHNNLLTTLPHSVATINFNFSSLSVYNNSFDCSCDQIWLKNWLIAVRDRLDNGDGILCSTPPRLQGKSILSVSDADFCYVPAPDATIIASAVVAPLLCVAAAILLLRIFRVESYKRFRFHPFDRDECAGEEMTYDVFISYAHGDKELSRELLEFLENSDCRVCFHQRDFVAGETVIDNILEAVYKSKRVLCVVTPNFLQSLYCLDEFNIAQTRNVELKKRRLIIAKYEEFDIGAQMEAMWKNEGEEQNQAEIGNSEADTQQLLLRI